MNSIELIDKKNQLKLRCKEMIDTCKSEIRDFTGEERKEFDDNKSQILSLNEELRNLEDRLSKLDEELPNDEETRNLNNLNKTVNKTMEKKNFSLIGAIRSISNNKNLDETANAVVNAGAEEMRKSGLSFNGQIQIPSEELRADITVASEGEDVVVTDFQNILEPLRAKNVLVAAGAKFLTGLVGDVQVPFLNGSNVAWESEVATAQDGAPTFGNVKMSPKRLTAYIDVSKQFLAQDSLSAEAMLRQDLVNALNSKLESTILGVGEGSANEPKGIFYEASTGSTTTISDFKGVCDFEAALEDENVLGEAKYVMSNKAKAAFRNMPKSTKSTQLVMEGNAIDGTPVLNTSHVADKYVAYGDWSNLAIGQWSGLDIIVDPYSCAKEAKVRIVVNAYFDAKVLRPNAIKTGKVA